MSTLEVNNVSIRYLTGDFKEIGLKEYTMRKLKGNYHVQEFWADKNISFTLEKGDMLGIIGTNGAGKSTLLKVVSGIMEPTGGYVKREGNVAALLELASGFDGDLTVRENAYLRGAMLGYTRRFMDEKYDEIIDFAELRDFQDRPFKQLSSGMKSRLAFSIASLVQPDLLILDEVLSVGDGAFQQKSAEKMQEIIHGGATTILVSHSVQQIRELCNKVLWLDHGKQIAFGANVEEICNQYEAFLEGRTGIPSTGGQPNGIVDAEEKTENERGRGWVMCNITEGIQLRAICALLLMIVGAILMFAHSPQFILWGICALLFCADCWEKRAEWMGKAKSLFSKDAKQNLKYSLAYATFFTVVAHGFLFANEFFSHDSLRFSFYSKAPNEYLLGLGRFIIPLCRAMKGPYAAPWLIGLLFTGWMVLVCFLVIEFFQLKSKLTMAMVCGLLCTNVVLTLTGATYVYCLDEYALALLASVAAAYCFCRMAHGELLGVFLTVLSLGIYQAYFTVTCALCFIFAIQQLVKNESAARVLTNGMKQVGLVFVSVGAYFAIWTGLCTLLQATKYRTNESILGRGIPALVVGLKNAYSGYFKTLFNAEGLLGHLYATANILIVFLLLWKLFCLFRKENVNLANKCVVAAFFLLVPFVFNSPKIIFAESATDLTGYANELIYILLLAWLEWDEVEKNVAVKMWTENVKVVAIILLACILYNNVLLANQAYMKKNLEKTATISLVTRLIERVEALDGYSVNETPVYVVGDLSASAINRGKMDIPYLESKAGLWCNYAATYNVDRYITDYLNYPMKISATLGLRDVEEVQNMPAFPAAGSVKMFNGAVVVKLS